jgi:hypothetical protein
LWQLLLPSSRADSTSARALQEASKQRRPLSFWNSTSGKQFQSGSSEKDSMERDPNSLSTLSPAVKKI